MTDGLRPLGPAALSIRRARVALQALAMAVVSAAILIVVPRVWEVAVPWWALAAIVVVVTAVAWWWTAVDHRHWAWRFTSELFEVQWGVVVRHTALVPRSRIQNVTTSAGPLQSRFGLVTLMVHTAGARTRNVSIEDIDVGHAESIRRRLGLA